MRQLNEAELFYLSQNRKNEVSKLAKSLKTTVRNVEIALSQLPELEPVPVAAVEAPSVPPLAPGFNALARAEGKGAIAMTREASEMADEAAKRTAALKPLPEGVSRFRAV